MRAKKYTKQSRARGRPTSAESLVTKALARAVANDATSRQHDELFVYHYSTDSRIGRRCIFTNAFEPKRIALAPGTVPAWSEYRRIFNIIDKFNAQLSGNYWPFRRQSGELALHDFLFTVIPVDIYNIYCELHVDCVQNLPTFVVGLAVDLYKYGLDNSA